LTLRVVFFGSPEFAVPTLCALLAAEEVVLVVTQPDKPAGRGQKLAAPPVKVVAEAAGVPVLQPKSVRTEEFQQAFRKLGADVAVVVAYGKILPQVVLDTPKLGCLNVHASLLPKYRGAAPIQWALIRGELETGVTIMKLDAGMDTGPLLMSRAVPIADGDTAGALQARLSKMGAELMMETLRRVKSGGVVEVSQEHAQATMAPLLTKEHGRIDWTKSAVDVRNLVRGVDPWPGAFTMMGPEVLKVWSAKSVDGSGHAGQVLGVDRDGLVVACGSGAVALAELQLPGRKRMPVGALVAGRPIPTGTKLG